MFSPADYDRMYELLTRPKVRDGHPEVEQPCCRENGIFLYPGEKEYVEARFPQDCYRLTYEADVSDLFKIAGMQWVFHCENCRPEGQPLGCLLYPTLAYIEQWNYRGIILDKEFFYAGPCEICDSPEKIDEGFLRAAYGVWAWLCTDPKVASILARISGHARQSGIDGYWFIDPGDNLVKRSIGGG